MNFIFTAKLAIARFGLCVWTAFFLVWGAVAGTAVAGVAPQSFYQTAFERKPSANELTELGRLLFFDTRLSASGKMACGSCHSATNAFSAPNARPVQMGGLLGKSPGLRAVPSLMYLQATPSFSEHTFDNDGDDSQDQGPAGGRTWDGRTDSAHDQAAMPLLSPFEMANVDPQSAVARLQSSPSAQLFLRTFGPTTFNNSAVAWNGLLWALEVFQQSPQDFYPYSSKYDAFLRGQVKLSPTESQGLAVFNDPSKGNCAQCHPSGIKRGVFPVFTDYGYVALGVPRNPAIAANRNPAWFDMGLCGPLRTDLREHKEYCGLFKTPSLRNVSIKKNLFHNGIYHALEDALRFYAIRDTDYEAIYPRDSQGKTQRFNDLPASLHANIHRDPPFGGKPGGKARISTAELSALLAFLRTLNDGYIPPASTQHALP